MRVTITGVTAKGMAYLWIADHIRPQWLCNWLLEATRPVPLWIFRALGFKGKTRSAPLVFDNANAGREARQQQTNQKGETE